MFPPGLDFLVAFLGCLHAGVVAVPCVPPRRPLRRSLDRLVPLVESAEPTLVLAVGASVNIVEELRSAIPGLARCPLLDLAVIPRRAALLPPRATPRSLAFLQYTSGSTSAPKGVMVSHANLMHNLAYIHEQVAHTPDSVSLTWLPAYHDMGLVDGQLEPLFGGFRSISMPPYAFLQRPVRWLRAISRYRATHSGGPNFAYDLCVDKIPAAEAERLDLSSWKFAHNGAEPIRVSTLDAFASKFVPAGFRKEAFYLCYGLAEATVSVAGGSLPQLVHRTVDVEALEAGRLREAPGGGTLRTRTIASCGRAPTEFDLAIVDPASAQPLGDGAVGEIWLAGPSVTCGYFHAPEETKEVFEARTADGAGPYLRTGDLGFVKDGQLYVVGRIKDLVIVAGRNVYPHDVELSACRAHELLRGELAAAFSVDDGNQEHLVVLVEAAGSGDSFSEVIRAVRAAVARDHAIDASLVGVVPRGDLLRTSSGKIRRQACKQAYEGSRLRLLASQGAPGAPRSWVPST
jgi:acyl-CoA synthetase (AMP-forming)/AMP-acid ligase II